jgi:hypothetical protein
VINVPLVADGKPGTWQGLVTPGGRRSASYICPNGHVCSLERYEILKNGSVHPSVLCSTPGCGFNEFITLDGWEIVLV